MAEVEVIKAVEGPIPRKRDYGASHWLSQDRELRRMCVSARTTRSS